MVKASFALVEGLPKCFSTRGKVDNLDNGWTKVMSGLHMEELAENMTSAPYQGWPSYRAPG